MKREKQKCLLVYYFINIFTIIVNVQGYSTNKLNNSNSNYEFYPNNNERSGSLHSSLSDNGQQINNNYQHLHNYFQKIMEPIRNTTNSNSEGSRTKSMNFTSESYYRPGINDKNTLPNYIYPSLHSTPYTPTITERYNIQNHLTQKKDSADSGKIKSTRTLSESHQTKVNEFLPKMIPVANSATSFTSRSLRVFDLNDSETFQPFVPDETQSRALNARSPTKRKDVHHKTTIRTPTASRPSVQPSVQANRKSAPEVSLRNSKSSLKAKELEESRSKIKKKYRKYMLPLLLAYKLKFFTLIPLMMGGLVLLTGATGMAGFFFALFASVIGLRAGNHSSS